MNHITYVTTDFAQNLISGLHVHIVLVADPETVLRTGWATRGSDGRVYVTDTDTSTVHGPYASLRFAAADYLETYAEAVGSCKTCLGAGEIDDPMSDYTPFHGEAAYCLCEAGKEAKEEHERHLNGYPDAGDYEDLSFDERMDQLSMDRIAEFFDDSEIVDARFRNAR